MAVDDPDIKRSLEIARERGLQHSFSSVELEGAHPNTVVLNLVGCSGANVSIRASSVGGGAIRIDRIGDGRVHPPRACFERALAPFARPTGAA
jgi:L-serine dehydratase